MCHQGTMEDIFLDAMREKGLEVERSRLPTSMQISHNERDLKNKDAHIATVCAELLAQCTHSEPLLDR